MYAASPALMSVIAIKEVRQVKVAYVFMKCVS